jgi:DNA-binding protein HU-beta
LTEDQQIDPSNLAAAPFSLYGLAVTAVRPWVDGPPEVEDDADADHGLFGREDRINKKQAKLTLDELNALVVRELKKEGAIRVAGLGIFRKRKLKARIGRNPATGEQIKIPVLTGLRFIPAKALKDAVLGTAATATKAKPSPVKSVKKK